MGNRLSLCKQQVKRKKKLEELRSFLIRLAISCNSNDVQGMPDSDKLTIILRQSNHFLMLLIKLYDNLQLIYNLKHLNEEVVYKIETVFYNIKDTGELLLLFLRYVILGEIHFNVAIGELKQVNDMFIHGLNEIQHSFSTIFNYVIDTITITDPKSDLKRASNTALKKVVDYVFLQLLVIIQIIEQFQHRQEVTKQQFYATLQAIYGQVLKKIAIVGAVMFLAISFALFTKTALPWALLLSVLCAVAEFYVGNHILSTSQWQQMQEAYRISESKINTRKRSGRIFLQDG